MWAFLANLVPTILSIADKLPLKGYRNPIFMGLAAVVYVLGSHGVVPPTVSDPMVTGLLMLAGYFAGKH